MAAIEKLIGKTIPRIDGGVENQTDDSPAPSSGETGHPRGQRARQGEKETAREGSRGGRKPRREREPRRSGGSRNPQPQTPAVFTPPAAPPVSRAPSIGRAEAPQAPRDSASEPADHSHLPAFLLRPVRARV